GPHVVTEPTVITVALDSIDPTSCSGGNDGTANITATGGTGTLNYNWTGGQTTQNATGLTASNYTVTVTDANGCSTTSGPHIVNAPTAISVTQDSTTSPSCNGTSDGAIYISVTGGTTSYSFVWSAAGQTTEDLVGIASGTYTVTVTDANNCEQTFTTSINQPGAVGLSLDASSNVDCAGNNNGSISITASGGSPGYSFIWSNNSTAEDLTGLSGGTYIVTVTDANNCTDTLSTVITEPTALVATVDSTHSVSCGGSSDGAAFTSVTGGTGSYSFMWSNSSTTEDINSLAVGTYTLVVTDQNSCTDTVSATVGSASGITIVDTVNNASCNGASDGTINLTVSGGTPGYTYLWSNAGETTQNITGISAGSYSVTVTDGAGCAIPYTPNTITEPAAISISLVSSTDPSCSGNDGSIDINVNGGSGGYTYAWSNSASSQDLTNLGGGTYTVTVTDANSCSNTSSATLGTATGLTLQVNTITGILDCDLASIGQLEAVPSTTDTSITYLWSNGDTTATADGLAAGAYTVTATTSTGCTATASGTIEAPVVPTLNAFVNNIGTTDTIVTWNDEISLNAGNDQTAQGVSYAWTFTGPTNGDAGITNSNAPSTTALPTEDGVYDLVITATATTSGVVCTAQDNLKVTVKAKFQGVPNAFTPNADTENDLFRPIGLESDDIIEFKVFNRWGQVMYDGDDLAGGGWDGTHNGVDQPRDVYVYVLRFQQTGDEKETLMRGCVTLMR
ncbi:MAG: T9SS type B sorting domain-containing protein, partial [Aureispira sp.]|nr:T9SS type B sorting domain-containing protein [Aureispira sp.]